MSTKNMDNKTDNPINSTQGQETDRQVAEIECLNINDEEANTSNPNYANNVDNSNTGQTDDDKKTRSVSNMATNIRAARAESATVASGGSLCSAGESSGGFGSPSHSQSILVDESAGANSSANSAANYGQLNKHLIMAALISALGSSFQHGYNGGVVNAPEKLISEFINRTKRESGQQDPSEAEIDLIFSVIVSIYCVGGCIGALLTTIVADRLGRRDGLFYNCFLVLLACPLMASARSLHSYRLLIFGRFLIGINAGLNAGLGPLYLNEIAPVNLRGAFGTIYQLVLTLSIFMSNVLGLPLLLGSQELWPFLFLFPIIPAALMLATLLRCCESPKYLLLVQGRELQAQQSLAWLRGTADIQDEMDELRAELERSKLLPLVTLAEMWRQKSLRRATTISIVIMLSQQLSGINAILFYSTSIFRDAGLSQQAALQATLGMSLVNVLMTGVSLVLVDRAGRKTLHMSGLLGMAVSCIVLSLCLGPDTPVADENGFASSWIAVLSVYSFIIMFASGPGSIPWFLVGELVPCNARSLASSIAVSVNWSANFAVTLCFIPMTNVFHGYTFIFFALSSILFYLFTHLKVPETKGVSAEEISTLLVR